MYSVENPAFRKRLSPLEVALYGPRFTGVGAQILGANDKYICQYTEESQNFWGGDFLILKMLFHEILLLVPRFVFDVKDCINVVWIFLYISGAGDVFVLIS